MKIKAKNQLKQARALLILTMNGHKGTLHCEEAGFDLNGDNLAIPPADETANFTLIRALGSQRFNLRRSSQVVQGCYTAGEI